MPKLAPDVAKRTLLGPGVIVIVAQKIAADIIKGHILSILLPPKFKDIVDIKYHSTKLNPQIAPAQLLSN
ncbi:hypothetical protein TUM4438_11190 [Shewanella sairae]|uniref:Uncharacterized protein n=1 Tax=Shewanella sairae TaxID=190310 RepID=A0ABQ4P6D2_9GAMM|nr:hypothetical protein TUM4438_11190 [Shewanella sairae]